MGMTNENLCDSCTNKGCIFQSGIVRTECAFYIPPSLTCDNCGNYVVVMQPIVEAILKDEYEARLKADMVAILDKVRAEIENMEIVYDKSANYKDERTDEEKANSWGKMYKVLVLSIIDKYKKES